MEQIFKETHFEKYIMKWQSVGSLKKIVRKKLF